MKNSNRLIYLLALVKIVLPFLLQDPVYQPHRDEFLYLAEGRHLAFGYMEVPPLLSLFSWLAQAFGGTMFWIKIWPSLFGGLTFLLVGRIIQSLGGKTFAILLGFLPFVFGVYLRVHYLFQPNFLEIFFWTLIGYTLLRYIQTSKATWLYYFGISIALGILSKYTVIFYTGSILLGLLLTPQRKIFLNRHLYFAGLITFVIISPNIYWQYQHNYPLFFHMKELQETQLQFVSRSEFLVNQFLMNLPCVFIWIAGCCFLAFNRETKPYRLFAIAYFAVITYLAFMHAKDYYSLGVYPLLFAFGAVYLEKLTELRARWTRYAMVVFVIVLAVPLIPLLLPVARPAQLASYYKKLRVDKSGAMKWEDLQYHPLPQDFADMFGWKETTAKAAAVYNALPPEQRAKTLVYCRSYCFAGCLNFYGRKLGLPEVYSDNASFLLWMPDRYDVKNLLLVGHKIPGKDDAVFQQFEKMTVKDSLVDPLARENGIKIILFENGNDSVNTLIERGIAEMKGQFRRKY
ncbi:MAG: hypothetical protein JWQ78_1982 [Sediminibacterium sp.]|nr:hypothetical protein [Sediminibacterium sp.]